MKRTRANTSARSRSKVSSCGCSEMAGKIAGFYTAGGTSVELRAGAGAVGGGGDKVSCCGCSDGAGKFAGFYRGGGTSVELGGGAGGVGGGGDKAGKLRASARPVVPPPPARSASAPRPQCLRPGPQCLRPGPQC